MSHEFLRFTGALVLASLAMACGDDKVEGACSRKGEIDRSALDSGATVTLSGELGEVELLFLVPIPNHGDDDDLQAELASAVSFIVTSNESGATAELSSEMIVESTPAASGEWSWELDDDRNVATITFFNGAGGPTLDPSDTYEAALSIATNEYIEAEDWFTFTITVVED